MNERMIKRPSPAFVVAMIALFVALGGTAGAVVNAAVPLAKRALVADNAKKLNGVTANQLGSAAVQVALRESPAGPRPASTAAGLVTVKTAPASLAANGEGEFTVSCESSGPCVMPVRNSAQPSGVEVSIGSVSDTSTFTVSPVDEVMGPPRHAIAARARLSARSAVPGAVSIDRACVEAAGSARPAGEPAATTRAATSMAPELATASGRILGYATPPL